MKHKKNIFLSLLSSSILFTQITYASNESNVTKSKDWIILPYAFSSDATGLGGGIGVIKQGILQPQTTLVATLFAGGSEDVIINGKEDKSNLYGGFLAFSNYKLPFTNRVFFSFISLKSYIPRQRYYFEGENDSRQDTGLTTSGESSFFNSTLEYVLPIGEGADNPEGIYTLQDGFAQGREGYGNDKPFVTGRTSVGIKTFYQTNSFDNWSAFELWKDKSVTSTPVWNTNGLRFFLKHDNTDFDLNPSRGYHFDLTYSKDFGYGDSTQSWDFLEFKFNKYYNLDTFSFTQQNVLALSLWTGYSFSWDNDNEIAPGINADRPPPWEGARLGGFNRLRGYASNRFSDKSVFYATAEYRAVLDYNPLKNNSLVPVAIDWFQLVAFVEAGRVNDQYNFELLTDLKYDVGVSLRSMVAQLPVRFDVAYGDEGVNMWVMIQHPFDF